MDEEVDGGVGGRAGTKKDGIEITEDCDYERIPGWHFHVRNSYWG